MSNTKPIFNLYLTYEEALKGAEEFNTDKELYIWKDPRNFYDEPLTIRTDEFYPTASFDENLKEMYEIGEIDKEAKAALLWLINKHKGFNPLELGKVIVGVRSAGFSEDEEVAIFAYLSKADDCLRDFISELAYELTNK